MTKVTLVRTADGLFSSCTAEGHAGAGTKGGDIVCSAVTVLLRTAMQVLCCTSGVRVKSENAIRGRLSFAVEEDKAGESGSKVNRCEAGGQDEEARLVCVADFIEAGFASLSREYPKNVKFESVQAGGTGKNK